MNDTPDEGATVRPPYPQSTITAAHNYLSAVGKALTASGAYTDSGHVLSPTAVPLRGQIYTRHDGGRRDLRAVLCWDSSTGWFAGWAEPATMSGPGEIRDKRWFNAGVVAAPTVVATNFKVWLGNPERYFTEPTSYVLLEPLSRMLAPYGATDEGSVDFFKQLNERMLTEGISPAEHYRAAEITLAEYGDDMWQSDLAAAQVHATLAATHDPVKAARLLQQAERAADVERDAAEHFQQQAQELQRQVSSADVVIARHSEDLAKKRQALEEAERSIRQLLAQLDQARRAQAADGPPCPADLAGMRRDAATARQHGGHEWPTHLANHVDRLIDEVTRLRAANDPSAAAPAAPIQDTCPPETPETI